MIICNSNNEYLILYKLILFILVCFIIYKNKIYFYIFFIIFAGFPATITSSGISLVTTEPAPTTEFSPIVTPLKIVAPAPIQQFFFDMNR